MSYDQVLSLGFRIFVELPTVIIASLVVLLVVIAALFFIKHSVSREAPTPWVPLVALSIFCSLFLSLWFGLGKFEDFFVNAERERLADLEGAPGWRNSALSRTADELSDSGEVVETVDTLNITSSEELRIYAREASTEVRRELEDLYRDAKNLTPQTDAELAAQALQLSPKFQQLTQPIKLGQDNDLADQVLKLRIEEIFGELKTTAARDIPNVRSTIALLAFVLLVLASVIVGRSAYQHLTRQTH